jgi:DmsE family decaheme c-type cytochrome
MEAQPGARRALVIATLLAAAAAVATSVAQDASPAAPEDPWSEAAVRTRLPDPDKGAKAEDYVGGLECKECHDDRWKSLGTSFHAGIRAEKKGVSRGCESCHGPGWVHYEDGGEGAIRHPAKADAKLANGACIVCHADVLTKPIDEHREWIGGEAGTARRCVDCHFIHVDKSAPAHDPAVGPFTTVKELAKRAQTIPASECIACHADFHPEMAKSGHAYLIKEGQACQTCHGPGSLHRDSGGRPEKIINPTKQRPKDVIAACNACHVKGESVQRWTCSEHGRENVSCTVCHDTNGPKKRTLRGPEFELCGSCHQDVKAKFRLPNRHRVKEGRIACSDCHDPHGNRAKVRNKDLRLRNCWECHKEKRGPFLFDHGIKMTEGCVACHEPHGSVNRRLLTHQRTQDMCLQCHPGTGHDLSDRRYRNCINCHTEMHGSDLDRTFRR